VIVPLNDGGDGPAFYCVHSIGGGALAFRALARALGPDQRFYGVQAPLTDDIAALAGSMESLAGYYVRELIEFQPEGPYILGGWSAGSSIALEMAQQLQQTGRHVDLLVALDGAPFNTGAGRSPWNPVYGLKLLRNLPLWISDDLLTDFSLTAFARRVRNKAAFISTRVTAMLGRHQAINEVEGFQDASNWSPAEWELMRYLNDALRRYVPKPYAGRVLLYRSRTEPLYHLFEVDRVWRHLSSDVTTIRVPGTHLTLIREPHVARLAADLRARLADAGAPS
jgi:thioesterase domain-containing protein